MQWLWCTHLDGMTKLGDAHIDVVDPDACMLACLVTTIIVTSTTTVTQPKLH